MTPGPEEAAAASRGHLRASHADREHVIAVLKAAFAHGRLTKEEFDARVGQTLASRTYADLASLTADIPAGPVHVGAPGGPARTLATATCRAGICMLLAVALAEGGFLANSFGLIVMAAFAVMAASGFFGYGVLDSWQQRRPRGHQAAGPAGPGGQGQGGQEREGRRHSRAGRAPTLRRPDQTRAELRVRRSRAQPGIRPIPGAA